MNSIVNKIVNISIFTGIAENELATLLKNVTILEKKYGKGSMILFQDDPYESLFIITKGKCYGEMLDFTGKSVKIEDLPTPVPLAPAVLFSSQNRLPVSIIAKTDCEALIISKKDFLTLCLTSEQILNNYLELISNKFVFISKRLNFLSFKTIKGKIANYILSLPVQKDGSIKIPFSIEELANFFGVTRPSLSRVLLEIEAKKVIKREHKTIKIIDKNRLVED